MGSAVIASVAWSRGFVPPPATSLLQWYDRNRRRLPWRALLGEKPDPYRVWLSEVMLQQTTVPAVIPYYERFVTQFPTVEALAAASLEQVLVAWAGLGYYARARNLIACARKVAGQLGGVFPDQEADLRALPGVGGYTAAAITAIAFDQPANVLDANIERVVARLFAVEAPLPAAKAELAQLAQGLVGPERPGDWAQALMDLGALVCTPAAPACERCPAAGACRARRLGPETYPRRSPKAARPRRHGAAFLLLNEDEVALVRRPPKGLLGGMLALPTSEWRARPWADAEAVAEAPAAADWRAAGEIDHVFTHFALTLRVFRAEGDWPEAIWTPLAGLEAMPSVFLKAARVGLLAQPQLL